MGLDNELRVSITADTEGLQGGLAEAQDQVAASSGQMAAAQATLAAANARLAETEKALIAAGANLADANTAASQSLKVLRQEAAQAAAAVAAMAPAEEAATAAAVEYTAAQNIDTKATYNRMEAMGAARVTMGAMAGSTGMMAGGLARMAAGSQVLGPLLNNMLPLVLFAAGAEMIYDLGKAIYTAFDMGGEAAEKFRDDLAQTNLGWRTTADATQAEIDKLDAANAKLEHIPNPNAQYEAIHRAAMEADKLDEKLTQLLGKEEKLTEEFATPKLAQVLTLGMGGTGVKYEDTLLKEHIRHLDEATTAQQINDEELRHAASLQTRLKELQQWQTTGGGPGIEIDYSKEIAATQHLIDIQQKEVNQLNLMNQLTAAQDKHDTLTAQPKAGPSDNMPEQIAKAQIDAAHAADAELNPMEQILGTLDKQLALNQINAQYSKEGTAAEREKLRVLKDQADTAKAVADVNKQGDELIAKAAEQAFKEEDEAARKAAERDRQSAEEWKRNHETQIAMAKEAAEAEVKAAADVFEATKLNVAEQLELGKIGHKTATQMLLDAQALKEQTTQGALKKVTLLYDPVEGGKELQEFKRAEDQMTAEARKAAREREQIEKQEQQNFIKGWKAVTNTFNQDFTAAFNSWMTHSQTAGKAFGSMLGDLGRQTIDFAAMYILKKAEMWAMDKTMQALGLATQHAQQGASNVATVTADAGVAAAGAMAYYAPINPMIAPAMAQVAFSETMAYAPVASHEYGGIVAGNSGPVPIIAHAKEGVLTAAQTRNFQEMTSNPPNRSSNVALHYNPVIHGNADAGMLQEHSRQMMGQVRRMLRPEALA